MNTLNALTPEIGDGPAAEAVRAGRAPPRSATVLLPVWGTSYIAQFLDYGLPTLLAPGNLPALAAALPTAFILLTSNEDAAFIEEHPSYRRLTEVCRTQIRPIDHLITDGNNSTTLTLAFAETIRDAGDAALDTCFFLLVSDYIMSDGSLKSVVERMQRGISAVLTGNFQATREEALPWLRQRLGGTSSAATLTGRELVGWGLAHLHPATVANTVNVAASHNAHTNRLFWRLDSSAILGRFYLMHPLCVRPEKTDFVIGSSFDYSFVPEMCPSGNVEAITDSDEFLVVEMQPRSHEGMHLRPGPLRPQALARSLSEWTTTAHRDNAKHALVFHERGLPADFTQRRSEADLFVADIARRLDAKAMPHCGHPYWHGAIIGFHAAGGRLRGSGEEGYVIGPDSSNRLTNWLLWRSKFAILGRPPRVPPWHPAWPDYRGVMHELYSFLAAPDQHMLLLSHQPTGFAPVLADAGDRVERWRYRTFLQRPSAAFAAMRGRFDFCFVELAQSDMAEGGELIDRIVPLMKGGGRIMVWVRGPRSDEAAADFGDQIAAHSRGLVRTGVLPADGHFVRLNEARWGARRALPKVRGLMYRGPWLTAPVTAVAGGFLLALSLIGNLASLRTSRRMPARGRASSFIMRLTVAAPAAVGAKVPSDDATTPHPSDAPALKRVLVGRNRISPRTSIGPEWIPTPPCARLQADTGPDVRR